MIGRILSILATKYKIKYSVIDTGYIPSHRYESEKGIISLIDPCETSCFKFEIYCISGNLFDDIERYDSVLEVEERIKNLLL